MTTDASNDNPALLRAVLDAIPSYVFVVDEDVRIWEYNTAAGRLLGSEHREILRRRGGDILHCLHATEAAKGCGHSEICKTCVIRHSVNQAFAGKSVVRRRGMMQLQTAGKTILVSASCFTFDGQDLVLLVVEDINLLVELQRIVPICMYCKKVRDDEQYWQQVDAYYKDHWDLRFSHGLCPDCAKKEMDRIEQLFPDDVSGLSSDASKEP
jgi:hypothetical protein